MWKMRLVWASVCCILITHGVGGAPRTEAQLWHLLLSRYDREVRPVRRVSDVLNVSMELSPSQLIGVDEAKQKILLGTWIRLHWVDSYLRWKPSASGNITDISLPSSNIWLPDVMLYNRVSTNGADWPIGYKARLHYNGNVTYRFPAYLEASCKIDVTDFPFDIQSCSLAFGSSSFPVDQLDMYPFTETGNLENLVDSGEWELVSMTSSRSVKRHPYCSERYPGLTFTIQLKRRPLYYVYNVFAPSILITWINLFPFLLPVESGAKIFLHGTVLLTMVVFLTMVWGVVPPQSDVIPFIGVYFGASMILICLGTLASVVVVNLHFRGSRGRRVPPWLRSMSRCFGNLTCYSDAMAAANFRSDGPRDMKQHLSEMKKSGGKSAQGETTEQCVPAAEVQTPSDNKSGETTAENEWMAVARAMDRIFLLLFVVCTTLVTLYVVAYF